MEHGNLSPSGTIAPSMVIWRLNADITGDELTAIGSAGSKWEIADDVSNEFYFGSATQVTELSGIFTFGTLGYWNVRFYTFCRDTSTAGTHDVSMYSNSIIVANRIMQAHASGDHVSTAMEVLLKVEDLGHTFKTTVNHSSDASGEMKGDTADNETHLVFHKIGEI